MSNLVKQDAPIPESRQAVPYRLPWRLRDLRLPAPDRMVGALAMQSGIGAVLLLVLPALWPLVRSGFFVSDDGRFHVYRIAALAQAWAQGVLHPRLFPDFGFGYGQAVLNFYAPLSYWPGALLTLLGIGPATAAKFIIALGFVLAALAAYGYARSLWGRAGGVLAALAYTYFPYHLADAYLRGAIPEHFAFIYPPLILWAYTAAFQKKQPAQALLWSALAWAGLVYTHNLTAMMFAPVAACYLILLAWWHRRWPRLLPAAGSLVLALAMSAALWLPFIVESGTVGIGLGPSDGYRKHLAPLSEILQLTPLYRYRIQQGGAADHPLSWLAAVLFLGVLLLLAWRLRRRQRLVAAPALGFMLSLALFSGFMITAPSLSIWQPLAPVLAHLQYPWRFLGLTALGMLGVAGALPSLLDARFRWTGAVLSVLGIAILIVPLPNIPVQPLDLTDAEAWSPDRMWREDAEAGQVGATWTGEFLPLTVLEQRWALGRSKEGAIDGPALPRPEVRVTRLGYTTFELDINSPAPLPIRLHQFYLPGWTAWLDGSPADIGPTGELGLVTASLPAGAHHLVFRFAPTTARTAGAALAIVAVGIWVLLAWRIRRKSAGLGATAATLSVLALALALNSLGAGQAYWVPRQAQAAFEDAALLVGYDAVPARGEKAVDVTLYWFALRDMQTDYKAFVHLLDKTGQVAAQHDGDPGGGYTPTTRWRPGEIIPDRHRLVLPAGTDAGEFRLKAGLYQLEPMRNLTIQPASEDGRADLGPLDLR